MRFLTSEATCTGDSVAFKIKNIGSAVYLAQNYTIFEDHIIMNVDNTSDIPPGDSIIINIYADTGHTYRITLKQAPGFPALLGDNVTTASIEGCQPYDDGSFNTGFITQFSNGNRAPFMAIDCQQNVNTVIPGKKTVQPAGYQAEHYIYKNTDLSYKISFQNTKIDTAFSIVIKDTLSPFLDPSTLTMGSSSHPYTWRLYDQNILEVTFKNILLPSSNTNTPASHGFIKYNVKQLANNPIGTVIHNTASIYFDTANPIVTNQTWHTVGENFVSIKMNRPKEEFINIEVSPNPFKYTTTFKVQGKEYQQLQLNIYNLTGRLVYYKQVETSTTVDLSRENLDSGIYLYELIGDQKRLNTGKIIVQ